jgi:cellulase
MLVHLFPYPQASSKVDDTGSHDNRNDDIIDPSHKGPALVYVAPTVSNGAGNVWVKLFQEVYPNNQWVSTLYAATDKMYV